MSGLGAKEFISISINAGILKIAYIADALARKEVVQLIHKDVSGVSEQDMPKIVRGCINDIKAKNPFIINVIPASSIITKNIEIPSIDHNEIKEIVNLQASRHTPYSREEIIGRTSSSMRIWSNPEDRSAVLQLLKKSGAIDEYEMSFLNNLKEQRLGLFSARIFEVNEEPHLLTTLQDITDRKAQENIIIQEFNLGMRLNAIDNLNTSLNTANRVTGTLVQSFSDLASMRGKAGTIWSIVGRLSSGTVLYDIQNRLRGIMVIFRLMEENENARVKAASELDKIMKETQEASEMGINGTPTFIINKKLHVGYMRYDDMEKIIKKEL